MNQQDEALRDTVQDTLTRENIDVRSLSIEVLGGTVSVTGSVPTQEERRRLAPIVAAAVPRGASCRVDVGVVPVAPSDSLDNRGRSPLTGTSADSAHESKHQRDP